MISWSDWPHQEHLRRELGETNLTLSVNLARKSSISRAHPWDRHRQAQLQSCGRPPAKEWYWNVFHDRNQDLVSLSQDFLSKACHPVKAGCRSSGKENFLCRACIDKLTNGFTSSFIGCCCSLSQGMDPTVNIGIVLLIVAVDCFQNC